jgi:hypothetical protein
MAFDERTQASFDAAGEAAKQLLTLATAAIGATIALFDDGEAAGIGFGNDAVPVQIGLVLLAASVVFGLFTLGSLAGQLGSKKIPEPQIYAPAIKFFHIGQMASFGAGIVAFVYATIA